MHQVRNDEAAIYSPFDHQRRIDEIHAAMRAEKEQPQAPEKAAKPLEAMPEASPLSADPLDHRLAEELECIRRHLDQLGGILAGNPLLVQRHATQLQSIDLVNQVLGHIARIIASEDRNTAVDQVTLRELRARLQRKPLPNYQPSNRWE